jgi:hypothetical protein
LIGFLLKQELNQAVETRVDGDAKRRLAIVWRERQRFAGSDPRLKLEQPSLPTQTEKLLGVLVARRLGPSGPS